MIVIGAPQAARAGAFLNAIQSAGAASVSTAGETAIAEDADTVYYNPAGMTLLDRDQILAVAPAIFMSQSFKNAGSTTLLGTPVQGSPGNKSAAFVAPSLFAVMKLSGRVSAGFGLFAPFGQVNSYPSDWAGRYQLQSISLKTVDFDPVIAWRVTDSLSIGGGVDIQYAHLVRKNAVDFGSLCVVSIGAGCSGLGLVPQGADGRQTATGANWNAGFNVSLLYQLDEATHIGINYRSAVSHGLSGNARFDVPSAAAPLTAGGLFQYSAARAGLTFPEVIALGISHKIDERLTLLADLDWTGWDRLKQLTIDFANPVQPDQTLNLNWSSSIRGAIGGIFHLSGDTDLRAGISYDQTPISTAFRTADLADSDEVMFSAGVTHSFGGNLSATFSYSYGDFAAAPMNLTLLGAGTLAGRFTATPTLSPWTQASDSKNPATAARNFTSGPQIRGEILQSGIANYHGNRAAAFRPAQQFERGSDIRARRKSAENSFLPGQPPRRADRFLVAHRDKAIDCDAAEQGKRRHRITAALDAVA